MWFISGCLRNQGKCWGNNRFSTVRRILKINIKKSKKIGIKKVELERKTR